MTKLLASLKPTFRHSQFPWVAHSPEPISADGTTLFAARTGFVGCQHNPETSHKQQVCVLFLSNKMFKKKKKGEMMSEKVFEQVFVQLV